MKLHERWFSWTPKQGLPQGWRARVRYAPHEKPEVVNLTVQFLSLGGQGLARTYPVFREKLRLERDRVDAMLVRDFLQQHEALKRAP